MKDKTRELDTLREQIAELKRVEAGHKRTEEALQKAHDELELRVGGHTKQLCLLQKINNSINVGMPLSEVLQMATEGVREMFDYTACDIFLLENDKKSLILAAISVDSNIIKRIEKLTGLTILGYRVPLFEGSHFTEVVNTKKVCTISDPVKVFRDFTDNKKIKLLAGQAARIAGFKSSIVAPLIAEDEVIGAIGVSRRGEIASGDAEVLGQFASQMALAIRNKQTEEALLESEERYRGLVESAKDVIFTVSTDGTITSLNPAFETITGWSRAEWVGKQFSPLIHPDDLPLAIKRFQKTFQGKTVPMAELRIRVKSGEYRVGEFKTTPQIKNGKIVAMLGIVRDITERKRAEEEIKKRLMKFRLEDGNVYLVKEPSPDLCLRAFEDILKVGYRGLAISRTPEEKFKKTVEGSFEFLWLAESGVEKALPPQVKEIKLKIDYLPPKNAVLIDRLDYLIFKEGFEKTLSFVQHVGEVAYLAGLIVILSIDPLTLDKKELRLLEKEALEIEPRNKARLPEDLLEILRFIYGQNTIGIKPSYTDIGKKVRVSKPTVRRRIRSLISAGYMIESKRGMYKVVELTDKGRNLFFR